MMIEELRNKAKNFNIKKEIKIDEDTGYEEVIEHLMSEFSKDTVSISDSNGNAFYGCHVSFSKDGRRIEWFNNKHSGVIELNE